MSIELTAAAREAAQALEAAYPPLSGPPGERPYIPHPSIFDPVILLRPDKIHVADTARIDSFCKLEGGEGIYIGEYVHIASFGHLGIGGGILIMEDGSCAASGCRIVTGSNVPGLDRSCSAVHPSAIIKKSFVHLKRNATLFCGVTVLPGVTIGEGAVIAAGAVVNRDVPDGEMWAGIPARRMRAAVGAAPSTPDEDNVTTSEQRWLAAMSELYGWPR